MSLKKIKLDYLTNQEEQTVKFVVNSVQLDNQLRDSIYPVILSHDVNPLLNFIDVEFKKNNYYKEINFFHHFSVNQQGWNFALNIEQTLLEELGLYFAAFFEMDEEQEEEQRKREKEREEKKEEATLSEKKNSKKTKGKKPIAIKENATKSEQVFESGQLPQVPSLEKKQKNYFGKFLVGPIKCKLSVKLNENTESHNGFVIAMLQSGLSAIGIIFFLITIISKQASENYFFIIYTSN